MSAIGAVSSTQTYAPPQQIQAAQARPVKDDGDHDNDATESAASKSQESGKLNVVA
jgi:hypothetical protein